MTKLNGLNGLLAARVVQSKVLFGKVKEKRKSKKKYSILS